VLINLLDSTYISTPIALTTVSNYLIRANSSEDREGIVSFDREVFIERLSTLSRLLPLKVSSNSSYS
jgi:hypothetical protein